MDLFTLFEKGSLFGENKPAETVSVNNQDMEELVKRLNKASDDYYNGTESMSDREYDEMFDRLLAMEKETGVVLPDSPTQKVGAEAVSKLEKKCSMNILHCLLIRQKILLNLSNG